MVTLKRIGIISAGRSGFWMGVVLNFTFLGIALLLAISFGGGQVRIDLNFVIRVLVNAFWSGVMTSFIWGMAAFLYNLSARFGGGLHLEFDMDSPTTTKKKNGDAAGEEPTIV